MGLGWDAVDLDAGAVQVERGLRFHDLRRCYATWIVSDSVP
ncbi:hypothetical protein AB0B54_00165 [Microbispora bryophytorum]